MLSVNIHEAKTHLSRLVEDAAHGKSFIIARSEKLLLVTADEQIIHYGDGVIAI